MGVMKPRVLHVEEDLDVAYRDERGNVRAGLHWVIHPDDLGGYCEGYFCMNCHQRQKKSMPPACWVCDFPIKERQLEALQREMRPEQWDGTALNELKEYEEFEERMEKKRWVKQGGVQVWIG